MTFINHLFNVFILSDVFNHIKCIMKYVLKILKYFHLWIFLKAILNGGF